MSEDKPKDSAGVDAVNELLDEITMACFRSVKQLCGEKNLALIVSVTHAMAEIARVNNVYFIGSCFSKNKEESEPVLQNVKRSEEREV